MQFLFFIENLMCWHFPSWIRIKTATGRKLGVFYSSKPWHYFEGAVEGGHSFMLHFLCEWWIPECVLFRVFLEVF